MEIFNSYKNVIEKALNNDLYNLSDSTKYRYFSKGVTESAITAINRGYNSSAYSRDRNSLALKTTDLEKAAIDMGVMVIPDPEVGLHPDFAHLKGTSNTENHYIASAFIDIKNSTRLFSKYDNETIYIITNAIQLLAINICSVFGGFVQRLQGDGVFVYFGRKGLEEKRAVMHILSALSLFTYFIKNDVKTLFENKGLDPIYTRIGIDFGEDKDVLWAMAGKENVSEITTYSLHTSLASKMQGYAKSNQIIIGKNVVDKVMLDTALYSPVEEDRYIYKDPSKSLYYGQFVFDWQKFLSKQSFVIVSPNSGQLSLKPNKNIPIYAQQSASLRDVASVNKPYYGKF